MHYILTDIEGTSTSIAFVYDTLFPYFKQHITHFLRESDTSEIEPFLKSVQETVLEETGKALKPDELAQQLIHWTDADRKHPALKAIQGIVWRVAYQKGEIKGHVYPDVPLALERWKNAGIGLGVYSSGSVEAQRLLFGFSDFGDLTPYFSHYFDTQVGPKREASSYAAIAGNLNIEPDNILFLSDIEAELDAAAFAGMQTTQILRPGTKPGTRHPTELNFSTIF